MKTEAAEKSQIEKFREAARQLETDDSDENFDRIVKRLAKAAPAPKEPTPKKGK